MTTTLPAIEPSTSPGNGTGNILVVEDDPETNEVIVFSLALEGYGVRGVASRNEALEAMRYNVYQIVLMDLYMPGVGPREFLEVVRRTCPASRIILMTAGPHVRTEAQILNIKQYLGKPFTLEELVETIRKAA